MKKSIISIITITICLCLCSCGPDSSAGETAETTNGVKDEAEYRVEEDCYGYEIELPTELTSISTNYQSATQIMLMLGGEKIISGTSPKFINREWVKLIYPEFFNNVQIPYDNNGEFNVEELLQQEPELFLSYNESDTELTRNANIVTANIGLYDYDGIEQSVVKIGKLMGDKYYDKALLWQQYFQKNIDLVRNRVQEIPENEKVKVLFLRGDFEKTYGEGSVISSWISIAGGKNVLDGLESKESIVTPSAEEILQSQPDLIIIGDTNSYSEAYETIISDERFAGLDAVRNGNIVFNPYGIHQWEKYSGEAALQILWAAKTFYPEEFEDINLVEEVKCFYKDFHDFDITDEQAQFMILGLNPDGSQT